MTTHADIARGIQQQLVAGALTGLIPPDIAAGGAAPAAPALPAAAPQPSGVPGQPASPAPAPLPQPEPRPGYDIAPLLGENGLLLGKFKDPDTLAKSYWQSVNSGSALARENDALRAQLSAMSQGLPLGVPQYQAPTVPGPLPGSAPRVNPVARDYTQERTVVKLAEELGVDVRTVGDALQSIAGPSQPAVDLGSIQQIVRDTFRQEMAPIQAQNEADTYMRQHYPEAYQSRQELEMFVRTAPPEIQRDISDLMTSGNLAGAYRYAWREYQSALQSTAQNQLIAQSQTAEQQRLAARGAASMPSGPQGTPPHAVTGAAEAAGAEQEKALLERARAGDYNAHRAYVALKFGNLPGLKEKLAQFGESGTILP